MGEVSAGTQWVMTHARRAAILDAEARRLARVLARFGVLTRQQLAELSGARLWTRGRFSRALELAEKRGLIRHLGCGFYAPVSAVPDPDVRVRRTRRHRDVRPRGASAARL